MQGRIFRYDTPAMSFLFSEPSEITDNTAHVILHLIVCGEAVFATGNIITG
jgi:hypothetical protein